MRAVSIWNVYKSGREQFVDRHFHFGLHCLVQVAAGRTSQLWGRVAQVRVWLLMSFSFIFDRPTRFISHKQIFWFYYIICTRSFIFCYTILLFSFMLCILCLLYVIPFSPAFSITDIFVNLPSNSRFFRPSLFNIPGHIWKQMSLVWSSLPSSFSS